MPPDANLVRRIAPEVGSRYKTAVRVLGGLLVACFLAFVSSAVAAVRTDTSYVGRSRLATANLVVMPRGAGHLRLHLNTAGAVVRMRAEQTHNLEAFCLWTIPGTDEGVGMGTVPVSRGLRQSATLNLGIAVSFHYVGSYTCGLHVHHAGEEPSAAYVRTALVALRLRPMH
jgi:hypothetical protein